MTDLFGRRLDESVLTEATERFRAGMQKTLDKLDGWVETKGWKLDKKRRRKEKKALKKEYKKAKKSYAQSKNCR